MGMRVGLESDKFSGLKEDIEFFTIFEAKTFYNELYREIVAGNPVDTGLSKRSWTKAEEIRQLGDVGKIKNPQDYVIYLEEGSSNQAPSGFIRLAITKQVNKRQ